MAGTQDAIVVCGPWPVRRRAGAYSVVSVVDPTAEQTAAAMATVREAEGTTIVHRDDLRGEWAWLTVEASTALDVVGVTRDVSERLAGAGIPCNVIAGFHHDHLLVPVHRADDAAAALER